MSRGGGSAATSSSDDSDDAGGAEQGAKALARAARAAAKYHAQRRRRRDADRVALERAAVRALFEAGDVLASYAEAAALWCAPERPQWRVMPPSVDAQAVLDVTARAARTLAVAADAVGGDLRAFKAALAARDSAFAVLRGDGGPGAAGAAADADGAVERKDGGDGASGGDRREAVARAADVVDEAVAAALEELQERVLPAAVSAAADVRKNKGKVHKDDHHGHGHAHRHGDSDDEGEAKKKAEAEAAAALKKADEEEAEAIARCPGILQAPEGSEGSLPLEALAAADWRRVVCKAAKAIRVHALLVAGEACVSAGLFARAAETLKRVLIEDGKLYDAWMARGRAYRGMSAPLLAVLHFERAGREAAQLSDAATAACDALIEEANAEALRAGQQPGLERIAALVRAAVGAPGAAAAADDVPTVRASELIRAAQLQREEANLVYAEGYHHSAALKYQAALGLLTAVSRVAGTYEAEGSAEQPSAVQAAADSVQQLSAEELRAVDDTTLACHLNVAMCLLKRQTAYSVAERHATAALAIAPRHPKALYRRAMARRARGHFTAALDDLRLAQAVCGELGRPRAAAAAAAAAADVIWEGSHVGTAKEREAMVAASRRPHEAGSALLGRPEAGSAPHGRPDVVLVVCSGLARGAFVDGAWEALPCDARYAQHRAASAGREPALASMITGVYPQVHGVTQSLGRGKDAHDPLMAWLPAVDGDGAGRRGWTAAHALRDAGYATAYAGSWALSPVATFAETALRGHGFDRWLSDDSDPTHAAAAACAFLKETSADSAPRAPRFVVVVLGEGRRWQHLEPFRRPIARREASQGEATSAADLVAPPGCSAALLPSHWKELPSWGDELQARAAAATAAVQQLLDSTVSAVDDQQAQPPTAVMVSADVCESASSDLEADDAREELVRVPLLLAAGGGFQWRQAARLTALAGIPTSGVDVAATIIGIGAPAAAAAGLAGRDLNQARASDADPGPSYFAAADCPFVGSRALVAAARESGAWSTARRLRLLPTLLPRQLRGASSPFTASRESVVMLLRCSGMSAARLFKLVRRTPLARAARKRQRIGVPAAGEALWEDGDGTASWSLFDLTRDPEERNDLAAGPSAFHPLVRRVAARLLAALCAERRRACSGVDDRGHAVRVSRQLVEEIRRADASEAAAFPTAGTALGAAASLGAAAAALAVKAALSH